MVGGPDSVPDFLKDRKEVMPVDPLPVKPYVELDANSSVIGQYVIEGYEGNKNDWHYITIEAVNEELGEYKWTNKAGVEWSLKQSDEFNN